MASHKFQEEKFPPPDSSQDQEFYSKKELLPKLTVTKGTGTVPYRTIPFYEVKQALDRIWYIGYGTYPTLLLTFNFV